MSQPPTPTDSRELSLTRLLKAPPERVYAAWTQPDLLRQWFAPRPWTTPVAELDVRPGGSQRFVLRSPEGEEFPHRGVYLEVVPNARLVYTSAFTEAWVPCEEPAPGTCHFLMAVILTFEPEDGGRQTRYTARVRHWSPADCRRHAEMGFHEGWGQCADQLGALVEGRA
jgi:uncharacterized protein YndB with AHSA1/START domain